MQRCEGLWPRCAVLYELWYCTVCGFAADPDVQDQLTFNITAGNDMGLFKIAICRGQMRVALAGEGILDYFIGPRQFNLTVSVTDDGLPFPLSAFANFTINVVRRLAERALVWQAALWLHRHVDAQVFCDWTCRDAESREQGSRLQGTGYSLHCAGAVSDGILYHRPELDTGDGPRQRHAIICHLVWQRRAGVQMA
jgi:hypothetical protein